MKVKSLIMSLFVSGALCAGVQEDIKQSIIKDDLTTFTTLYKNPDVDLNVFGEEGNALNVATAAKAYQVAEFLLMKTDVDHNFSIPPDLSNPNKPFVLSPLMSATISKDLKMVRLLDDANKLGDPHSAFCISLYLGAHQVSRYLVDKYEMDINKTCGDLNGCALYYAALSNDIGSLNLVLEFPDLDLYAEIQMDQGAPKNIVEFLLEFPDEMLVLEKLQTLLKAGFDLGRVKGNPKEITRSPLVRQLFDNHNMNIAFASTHVGSVNLENYDTVIQESEKPLMIRFSADWCAPCKRIAPLFAKIAEDQHDKVNFVVFDVGARSDRTVWEKFELKCIPSFILVKDGKIVSKKEGSMNSSEFDAFLTDNF